MVHIDGFSLTRACLCLTSVLYSLAQRSTSPHLQNHQSLLKPLRNLEARAFSLRFQTEAPWSAFLIIIIILMTVFIFTAMYSKSTYMQSAT